MFNSTQWQLENARRAHRYMQEAKSPGSFRFMFESFVLHGRNVSFALQKEGKHLRGFTTWYQEQRERLRDDPLAKWFVSARNTIAKEGIDVLAYSMRVENPELTLDGAPEGCQGWIVEGEAGYWIVARETPDEHHEPMPYVPALPWDSAPPGARRAIVSYDGAYWEVEEGNGGRRLIDMPEIQIMGHVQASNPPSHHRGEPLQDRHNPVHLGALYLQLLGNLVAEARGTFCTDVT